MDIFDPETWKRQLQSVLGDQGRVTSGGRTQAEQDALANAGKTRARGPNAPHVRRDANGDPEAADIAGFKGSDTELKGVLSQAGYSVARIRNESGQGENQGTGAHRHVEFGQGAQMQPQATPTQVSASPQPLSATMDPFKAQKPLEEQHAKVMEAGVEVGQVLDSAGSAIQTINQMREDGLAQTVQAKEAIIGDIESQTEELQRRVTPIFAKRAAIAHRETELATMNPFKKAVLGAFNPNYSNKRLEELDHALAGEVANIGQEYQVTNALSETLMKAVSDRFAGQDALMGLRIQDLNTDVDIAMKGWQVQQQTFGNMLQGLSAGTEVVRAQIQRRDETLSQMTGGQINSALAQAKRGDGTALINGVPLSMAELQDRSRQIEGQNLAIEGQRLSVQAQHMGLKQQQESIMISHMSPTEIQTAIANNGKFRGAQLDVNLLTNAYQSVQQGVALQVGAQVNSLDGKTYADRATMMSGMLAEQNRRMQGVTGQVIPPQQRDFVNRMVQFGKQAGDKLRAMPDGPAKDQFRAQMMNQLGTMMQQQDKVIGDVVKGMTRDPDAQAVLGGWMRGTPVTGEQATKGLIKLASGGMPPGVRVGGPAAAAINAAKKAMDSVYAKHGGQAGFEAMMQGQGGKVSKDQLQRELTDAVSQSVSSAWNGAQMTRFRDSIPQLAKADGHPAGQIRPQDLAMATAAGQQDGLKALGAKLGWSDEQTASVFGPNGQGKAAYDKIQQGKQVGTYESQKADLAALTNTAMLRALDTTASAHEGFRPSTALVDFMKSDNFQMRVAAFNRNIGNSGFGEFMADTISSGSLGQLAQNYATALGNAQGAYEMEDQASARKQANEYRGTPLKRAAVILGAIPGLDQHSETLLLRAISDQVRGVESGNRGGAEMRNAAIDSAITSGKFEDPKLEKIRQIAAKHWTDYSASTDSAMDRLFSTIGAAFK